MKKRAIIVGAGGLFFVAALILTYQNCGSNQGTGSTVSAAAFTGTSGTFSLPVANLATVYLTSVGNPPVPKYTSGISPNGITSGRFNEAATGNQNDLIISGSSNVYRVPANGDGTFATTGVQVIFTAPIAGTISPQGVAATNYYEGAKDTVVSHLGVVTNDTTSNSIDMIQGNGNGTFLASSFTSNNLEASGSATGKILVADLNQDGFPDIGMLFPSASREALTLSQSLPIGINYTQSFAKVPTSSNDSAFADVMGTGIPALITVQGNTITVATESADPDLTFSTLQTSTLALPASGMSLVQVAAGDLNGDGIIDLVVMTSTYSISPQSNGFDVYYLQGTNTGIFSITSATTIPVGLGSAPVVANLVVQDFNEDGIPDIAIAFSAANSGTPTVQNFLELYSCTSASGSGPRFGSSSTVITNVANGVTPAGLTINNFNTDAIPDIVVATTGDTTSGNSTFYFYAGLP